MIKEIENVPAKLFEHIGMSIRKEVGAFLSSLMGKELTDHIGRERYERKEGSTDYRNDSYTRTFCIKGIGDVDPSLTPMCFFSVYIWHHHGKESNKIKARMVESLMQCH